jgi:hypothetical protein
VAVAGAVQVVVVGVLRQPPAHDRNIATTAEVHITVQGVQSAGHAAFTLGAKHCINAISQSAAQQQADTTTGCNQRQLRSLLPYL